MPALARMCDEVHRHGSLIEIYAADDGAKRSINLKRKDDGTYLALDAPDTDVATLESLFELIIRQQPGTSTLGKEGSPHLTEAQRIARLRLQIGALAGKQRTALFSAMTRHRAFSSTVPARATGDSNKLQTSRKQRMGRPWQKDQAGG